MYDKTVRRRRVALAVFIGLSLLLLTTFFGESGGGPLHAVQKGAQEAFSPLEEGASRAGKPFSDLVGWTGDVLGAKGENEELEREVERQRKELARAQTDRNEAEQLRGIVGLNRQEGFPTSVEPLSARVIARSPTVWYSTIQINKGSGDGVEVDQPVIASGGLAGRVTSVTGGNARVTLITDATSAVSAQIMPEGATGVVKPEVGDPNDLLLDFVERRSSLKRNAIVVTSGFKSTRNLESLFPRGIPIGKVSRVDAGEIELYQRVHVKPFVDFKRMDIVQVLIPRSEGQRAELRGEASR